MYEWDFTVQEMIDCIEVQVKNGWQTCSLESVARQVGYSSQVALTRAFKEAYGVHRQSIGKIRLLSHCPYSLE